MKTKLRLLFTTTLLATLFYGCNIQLKEDFKNIEDELKSCRHALNNCKSCTNDILDKDKVAFMKDTHALSNLDCNNNSAQQRFASNIYRGYEIFGKIIDCDNGKIKAISFTLIQPGTCKNLILQKAELFPYSNDDMPGVTNALLFTINNSEENTSGISTVNISLPYDTIQLVHDNRIFISTLSNDSDLGFTGSLAPGTIPPTTPTVVGNYGNSDCPKICWDGTCFQL